MPENHPFVWPQTSERCRRGCGVLLKGSVPRTSPSKPAKTPCERPWKAAGKHFREEQQGGFGEISSSSSSPEPGSLAPVTASDLCQLSAGMPAPSSSRGFCLRTLRGAGSKAGALCSGWFSRETASPCPPATPADWSWGKAAGKRLVLTTPLPLAPQFLLWEQHILSGGGGGGCMYQGWCHRDLGDSSVPLPTAKQPLARGAGGLSQAQFRRGSAFGFHPRA